MALLRLTVLLLGLAGCSLEPLTREELFGLPALVPRVRLTGTVSQASTGAPLSGVTVSLASAAATSDALGVFVLEGLAVGEFEGTATKEGFARRDFRVTLSEGTNRLNVELSPLACSLCARLRGTARNSATNAPVEGVTITVGPRSTSSDAAGAFRLDGLPEGQVSGFAVKPGYERSDFTVTLAANENVKDVALTRLPCGGCSQGLLCNRASDQCEAPATISLSVVDACTGIGVAARVVMQGFATCSTSSRGFAMLNGLTPGGPQTLAVGKPGYRAASSMVTLVSGFNALPEVRLERVMDCSVPITDEGCSCTGPECQP